MTEDQLQQLLITIVAGLNTVKASATFAITLGQASIDKVIDYSISTGINFVISPQSLPIKFNITEVKFNHLIEALKY